jgi:hypothetical protein
MPVPAIIAETVRMELLSPACDRVAPSRQASSLVSVSDITLDERQMR